MNFVEAMTNLVRLADEVLANRRPENDLDRFLEELPDELVKELAFVMYVGRGDFRFGDDADVVMSGRATRKDQIIALTEKLTCLREYFTDAGMNVGPVTLR